MLVFIVDLLIAMLIVSGALYGIVIWCRLGVSEGDGGKKMRLIDADKLMENKFKNDISYNAFCNLVKRQPSIDAVQVIRCKDCKWWTKQEDSLQGRCALHGMYPTGEWFCANARREEE